MFGFGVFLCYLAVPAPLSAALLGAPPWLVVLLPVLLFAAGLACMGIGNAMDWGPLPQHPDVPLAVTQGAGEIINYDSVLTWIRLNHPLVPTERAEALARSVVAMADQARRDHG